MDKLNLRGKYEVEHLRDGKVIGRFEFKNLVTNEGKNKLLDVMFHGATQIGTWYIALVDATDASPAVGDTYAQIGGTNSWDEFTAYGEATRQAWAEGAASGQSITSSSPTVFNINGSGTVYGMALVGGGTAPSTKEDAAGGGTLWSVGQFSVGNISVTSGDQLRVTYTCNS